MNINIYHKPNTVLLGLLVLSLLIIYFMPAIAQDIAYHNFADNRTYFNIPNFWNVFSNSVFIVIGSIGLAFLISKSAQAHFTFANERWVYAILFINLILTGIGSTYYHLAPNNISFFGIGYPFLCFL